MKPLNDIKNLYPLLQSNSFPFLEKTFDDIDEYAILARIQKAVNEVITNNNTLNGNFTELNNYVNDYFKNLDVQDEIDNKLQQMAQDGSLDKIVDKYITNLFARTYKNVNEMKADEALLSGMVGETLCYNSDDDLGGASYIIEDNTNQTIDNGEYILLNNNKVAHLIRPKKLYASIFGAKADGTDDLQAIQNAVNYMKFGDTLYLVPNKKYNISNTIHFKRGLNFDGNNSPIFPLDSFPTNNYILNIDSELTSIENNYSLILSLIKNINMQYYGNYRQINGIYLNFDAVIENAYFWQIEKCICASQEYIDFINISNISIWSHLGTEYAIDTGYIGDGRKIDTVHTHIPTSTNLNILKIGNGHNSIEISRIVNGNINLGNSLINMHDIHLETGNIVTQNKTKLTLNNLLIWKQANIIPLNFSQIATLKANNIKICYNSTRDYTDDNAVDIALPSEKCNINLTNCYKIMQSNNSVDFENLAGLTSNLDIYNNNKFILSSSSNIVGNLPFPYYAKDRTGQYTLLGTIYQDSNFNFKLVSGTYYYNAILLFDKIRMIGSNVSSNEVNIVVDNNCLLITVNGQTYTNLRLYRGNTSNQYSHFVDTTNVTGQLVEDGILCNGDKWQQRTTGNIDEFLSASDYFNNGINVIVHANSTPTVGQWTKGDIIINNNVGDNQPYGWICTANGTPGTWKIISTVQ